MYFLVGQQRTQRALTAWSAREVFQGRVNSLVFTHAAQFVVGLKATDEGIGRQSSSPKYRSTMNNSLGLGGEDHTRPRRCLLPLPYTPFYSPSPAASSEQNSFNLLHWLMAE